MRVLFWFCALDIKSRILIGRYSVFPVIVLHTWCGVLVRDSSAMSAVLRCPAVVKSPGLFSKIGTCRTLEKEDYSIWGSCWRLPFKVHGYEPMLVRVARPESSRLHYTK